MRVAVVAVEGVGGLERGIGRVLVGGIAAAVVEEDGCGLVGGEACVRGGHGGLATAAAAALARRSECFARSLAVSLARLLGLRGMGIADGGRGGGCGGGGTGTCAVLKAAHHHRACER